MRRSAAESAPAACAALVSANRILAEQGVLDAFGHVSLRHPHEPAQFLLSRNRAPALVEPADILTFNLSGEAVDDDPPPSYLERFIHAAVYAARPDVGAVVHSHSPSVLPFGAVRSAQLRPVSHMAGFLGEGAPRFEIRDVAGDASSLLVVDLSLGRALAASLGDAAVVLMRGHGATAVGADVQEAVFHAVYTERNARVQAAAMRLGEPTYLTAGEARAAALANAGQIGRAWDYWLRRSTTADDHR